MAEANSGQVSGNGGKLNVAQLVFLSHVAAVLAADLEEGLGDRRVSRRKTSEWTVRQINLIGHRELSCPRLSHEPTQDLTGQIM